MLCNTDTKITGQWYLNYSWIFYFVLLQGQYYFQPKYNI